MGTYYRLKELGYALPAEGHIIPVDAANGLEAATQIVADAEARAATIISTAEEAYQQEKIRGYQDGLEEARRADLERLLQEAATLDQALSALSDDLAHLVIAAMRKLSLHFDDFAKAEAAVRGGLSQMRRERRVELRVAPEQYEDFRTTIDTIARDFPEVELVDVVLDGSLVAPQIVVETSLGRVEGDYGQSLNEFEKIVRDTFAQMSQEDLAADEESEP